MDEQPNRQPTAAEIEAYPLDDAMISVVTEVNQAIAPYQQTLRGALILFLRQHGLQGNWQLAPNGREVVRTPEAPK